MAPFTCQAACEDKWRRRGPSRREDPLAGCDALPDDARHPGGRDWALVAPPPLTPAQADAARALWRTLDGAFVVRLLRCGCAPALPCTQPTTHTHTHAQAAGGLDVVLPPGMRGFGGWPTVDFAAAGARMRAHDVATASAQWRAFAASAPAYPLPRDGHALFSGRGVVIIGCVRVPAAPQQCVPLHA
jgi:hypothetical protein